MAAGGVQVGTGLGGPAEQAQGGSQSGECHAVDRVGGQGDAELVDGRGPVAAAQGQLASEPGQLRIVLRSLGQERLRRDEIAAVHRDQHALGPRPGVRERQGRQGPLGVVEPIQPPQGLHQGQPGPVVLRVGRRELFQRGQVAVGVPDRVPRLGPVQNILVVQGIQVEQGGEHGVELGLAMLDVVDEDQFLAGLHAAWQQPQRGQQRRLGRPRQPAADLDLPGPEPGYRCQGMIVGDRRELGQRLHRTIEHHIDLGAEKPIDRRGRTKPLQPVQRRFGLGVTAGLVRRIGAETRE